MNQLIKEKRIGVLAVQETHLSEEHRTSLELLFAKRKKIYISTDPTNPTVKGGVVIILNREITNADGAIVNKIVPGRALLVEVNWHKNK